MATPVLARFQKLKELFSNPAAWRKAAYHTISTDPKTLKTIDTFCLIGGLNAVAGRDPVFGTPTRKELAALGFEGKSEAIGWNDASKRQLSHVRRRISQAITALTQEAAARKRKRKRKS